MSPQVSTCVIVVGWPRLANQAAPVLRLTAHSTYLLALLLRRVRMGLKGRSLLVLFLLTGCMRVTHFLPGGTQSVEGC